MLPYFTGPLRHSSTLTSLMKATNISEISMIENMPDSARITSKCKFKCTTSSDWELLSSVGKRCRVAYLWPILDKITHDLIVCFIMLLY